MTQHPTRQLVVAHRVDITEKPRAGSHLRVVRPLTDRTVGQSAVGCDDCVKLLVAQRADLQFFRIPSQLDATNAGKLGLRIHPLSVRVRLSTVFGAIPLEAHRDLGRRRFCPWQPQLPQITTVLTTTVTTDAPSGTSATAPESTYRAWSQLLPAPGSVGVRGSSTLSSTQNRSSSSISSLHRHSGRWLHTRGELASSL